MAALGLLDFDFCGIPRPFLKLILTGGESLETRPREREKTVTPAGFVALMNAMEEYQDGAPPSMGLKPQNCVTNGPALNYLPAEASSWRNTNGRMPLCR